MEIFMQSVLITGGTVFVSKAIAEFYVAKGYNVYVLNRGTKVQPLGTHLIKADRNALGDTLKNRHFDLVVDTAYTSNEVESLQNALSSYGQYVFISSSAVYPETMQQPFTEATEVGFNSIWKSYGQNKIEAEKTLLELDPSAYILRPAYIYGPQNNVYRESFVFDCALNNRVFYLPNDGILNLQFYFIDDLCNLIYDIDQTKPIDHIINVGNEEAITVRDWVKMCYEACGKTVSFKNVYDTEYKYFFSFSEYEYHLNVTIQDSITKQSTPLKKGIEASLKWYLDNEGSVAKRPYIQYIDDHLKKGVDV